MNDVDQRDGNPATDDRHAAERLQRGVHQPSLLGWQRLAVLVHPWHGFDGHRIGDHVLQDVADRREEGGEHEPGFERHPLAHAQRVGHQAQHDQQAGRDQCRAEPHQSGLVPPDQVNEMAERHLQRPRNTGPEAECREKGRRESEILLDEEGPDDPVRPDTPAAT
jgi:hypothetical protein